MRVGSDFSGVGAFDQALIRLGIEYTTVFACDMDKYARQTYIANYGEPDYYPENVYDRKIPEQPLDIYMTSPPCQAFSIAGKKKGETDKRGVLFYNSHEFIIKNRPRYFIFENVKGLLSDDNGKTFQRWIDYLAKSVNGNPMIFPHEDSANYHVYHAVLNSKDYGVPQNRERIFIVGIRDDKDNSFRFPKTQHLTKRLKDVLEDGVDEKFYLSEKMISYLMKHQEGRALPFTDAENKNIANCIISAYHKSPTDGEYLKIKSATSKGYEIVKDGTALHNLYNGFNEEIRIFENYAPTIRTAKGGGHIPSVYTNTKIRRLTPRECFRLQDFPDTFKMPCSDTQMYKQAGNSITVGVLYNILKNLL